MLSQPLFTLLLFLLVCLALVADANFFWPKRHQFSEKSLDDSHTALIPNNFYDLFRGAPAFTTQRFSTLTKIDDSKGWVFQLDVPGLSLDEISVHAEGQVMIIRGDHKCGKHSEPTCIERHFYEEIRLSESADLDTAEADLDLGVLRVHIRPKSGASSRSRAVKIIDRARGKARSWGETLKNTFTWQHDANVDSVKHSAAEYGSEVEDVANDYIKQIQHKLQIPLEKQREFADRMHAKSQDVYRQLKEKSLTPNEAYNRLFDNAEEILYQIKQVAEEMRRRSEHVADEAWEQARNLKDKAGSEAESVARAAWETASNVKDDVKRRTEHASHYAKRQAEDAVSQAAQSAKSAASDVKETVERKAGEAYNSSVDMKNSAEQKVFEAVADGKETAKAVGEKAGENAEQAKQALEDAAHQASEKAGQVADKVSDVKDNVAEKVGDVKDNVKAKVEDIKDNVKTKVGDVIDATAPKVDEAAHKAKVAADEAAHRATITAQEATHTAKVAAGEATFAYEKRAENMAESLKRKLGL